MYELNNLIINKLQEILDLPDSIKSLTLSLGVETYPTINIEYYLDPNNLKDGNFRITLPEKLKLEEIEEENV